MTTGSRLIPTYETSSYLRPAPTLRTSLVATPRRRRNHPRVSEVLPWLVLMVDCVLILPIAAVAAGDIGTGPGQGTAVTSSQVAKSFRSYDTRSSLLPFRWLCTRFALNRRCVSGTA